MLACMLCLSPVGSFAHLSLGVLAPLPAPLTFLPYCQPNEPTAPIPASYFSFTVVAVRLVLVPWEFIVVER